MKIWRNRWENNARGVYIRLDWLVICKVFSCCDISLIQKFRRVPLSGGSNKGGRWGGEKKLFPALFVDISNTVRDTTNVPTDD